MSTPSLDARLERWMRGPDGALRRGRLAIGVACGYALFSITYLPLNFFSAGRTTRTLLLPGEERLPFLPTFEYLYVLTYFVAVLVVFTVRDYACFRRLACASMMTMVVAYATYLVWPVYVARPDLEITSLATWLLSIEYLEPPYNAFPSLHVAFSWLAVFAAQVSRRSRWILILVAIGVSVSTVLVKQHYIADAPAGAALAYGTWRLAARRGF